MKMTPGNDGDLLLMTYVIHSASPAETHSLGEALGKILTEGTTLLLYGGMGMGKTALTKGIGSSLGFSEAVSSPTYTLVNTYEGSGKVVHHFDLYRIGSPDELYEMGFDDYFDAQSIQIIEWPERLEGETLPRSVMVEIEPGEDECSRRMSITDEDNFVCEKLKSMGW